MDNNSPITGPSPKPDIRRYRHIGKRRPGAPGAPDLSLSELEINFTRNESGNIGRHPPERTDQRTKTYFTLLTKHYRKVEIVTLSSHSHEPT